jgi:hypothetical protein
MDMLTVMILIVISAVAFFLLFVVASLILDHLLTRGRPRLVPGFQAGVTPGKDQEKGGTEEQTPDIFLCHSKKDLAFVRRLARDLHELRVYAWFDEWELGPGDSLHDSITRALEQSAHIGVVVSPDSVESA